MNSLFEEVSGIALQEITAAGVPLQPDRIEDAYYYAELAYEDMQDSYAHDPITEKVALAKQAAIAFVKLKLVGEEAGASPVYRNLADSWAVEAQRAEHVLNYNPDDYDDKRINLFGV